MSEMTTTTTPTVPSRQSLPNHDLYKVKSRLLLVDGFG